MKYTKTTRKRRTTGTLCALALAISSCGDGFLETKPDSSIVLLSTVTDLWNLLDNNQAMNWTASLPQVASDEYFIVSEAAFNGLIRETQQQAYIWAENPYGSETTVNSWNIPYTGIFYANSVLDALSGTRFGAVPPAEGNPVKGSAHFMRAYLLFDLLRTFGAGYDPATEGTALGVPVRLDPGIDYTERRSTVSQSYRQVFDDLEAAKALLPNALSPERPNRPSRCAVYALYARIHLDRADYRAAVSYADSALAMQDALVDFNALDSLSDRPFVSALQEVIFYSQQVQEFNTTQYSVNTQGFIGIDPDLLARYGPDDLRRVMFYQRNSLGNNSVKRGYATGLYPFTGLAVDELYLIRAEGLARMGEVPAAAGALHRLLEKRHRPGTYTEESALGAERLLDRILEERRKELVWRGMRWHDIKRLNREGRNIRLSRTLGGTLYGLPPGDPRYTFPVPDMETQLSGIERRVGLNLERYGEDDIDTRPDRIVGAMGVCRGGIRPYPATPPGALSRWTRDDQGE